jgi:hypothetical protein
LRLKEEDLPSIEFFSIRPILLKSNFKYLTLPSAFATYPMGQRLKIEYKIRKFENGKEVERKYVKKPFEGLPLNIIGKASAK